MLSFCYETKKAACFNIFYKYVENVSLALIRLGFLRVVFSGGERHFDPSFIFQEELNLYQYNFIQLLNNLFKFC